ncbi:hypothetical protein [Longitalea arenae]|uniref:hypothetical protein n=1 Tax=Longitalea arenae TaxID=2812558 RepID=UPI001968575A|nr:hypothetical protein [Longitalea arenae]
MENSYLWKQCRLAYRTAQLHLKTGACQTNDEGKWIERAFRIAMHAWLNIEELVKNYRFADQQEEDHFYKSLQPQFLGLIDYLTLLYKSVLFQPDEGVERWAYWELEYQRCSEFMAKCKEQCRYYEQADGIATAGIPQTTNQPAVIFGANITYNTIRGASYSHLAGRIIALKKYMQYIKERRA